MARSAGLILFDTGPLLLLSRQQAAATHLLQRYPLMNSGILPIVSVVSLAELKGFAVRQSWGQRRLTWLRSLHTLVNVIPIDRGPLVDEYVTLLNRQQNHRQMLGIHDTWIASTAKVLNATLVTVDSGFRKLDANYLSVDLIDRHSGQSIP